MRVVIVDDHAIVRAGLSALLAREPDVHVVGVAVSGDDGLHLIRELRPDIAVVDYSLPGMTGVELCERVHVELPDVAVIILTTYLDDVVVKRSLEAGAKAYVYKDVEATELIRAIRAVAHGEAVLDPKVAGRVAAWAGQRRAARSDRVLSLRETEVLRLVARGLQNREIANDLDVTENTVRTYVRRILAKLGCQSRSEAAALASRRGLL